ncbi:putative Ig domain-containing protein, partial [Nostoc punctiforme FACHB-252]
MAVCDLETERTIKITSVRVKAMVSQDNFGSKNTSDNNGGLLPPSLLESASLDDNSDLIELRKSFRFTNSSDPFAKLTEPQNKSDISVPTSKTAKSSSVSLTNPVNLISSDESSSKNNPGQNLLVPIQSKTTKVDSTNKDLLTGEKNNTQLVGATAFDPLLGTVNNSLSTLSLLPDVLPPTLSATILPLDLLPGSPQARLVGIVNGTGSAIASLTVQFDNLAAGPISVSPLGTFDKVLDFAGLNSGTHTLTVKATDIAGNASVASFSLTLNLSDTPPAILAALARDTAPSGTTNTDTITFDPTTTGTVRVSNRGLFINALTESTPIVTAVANVSITETNYITSLKAGFDNIAVENYANVLADLRSDGSFTFNRTRLDAIYGGSLPDGHHTLHLKAIDKYGVTSKYDISFTLDTTTAVPILNLSPSSDSGVSNSDHITLDTTPTIVGTAEALATVKLFNNGQLKGQTTATTDGTWQITTSELTDGMYQLNAIATDIAGNTSTSANLEVTIDSALPQVNLTTPVGQFDLRLGDKLTGSVDGTGSAVTALSYRFNNLQDVSLDFDTNGNFDQVLDFTGLDNGEHTLTITATDTAGNIKTIQSTLRVIIDEQAPVIIASLLRDTAAFQQTNSDKITYDSTIIGTVKDASRVVEFKAGFDNTTVANFISVLPQRNIDGSFNFGRTQLETIYGGTLPDGIHTLHLQALDEYGNNSDIFDLTFVLDTNVLTPIFDLSPASDSPEVGDKKTVAETITLVGQTDAYATVVLEETNITTTASDTGKFSFDNVLLARGQNSFTARAIDIAGNENTFFTNIYRFSPPTGIALMGNTVAENSIAGTVIGQLDTTDPDIGDSFTYTLVDDALGRFQIVGNELQVANSNLLDFESNQQYSITVCSQDASGLSKTETFTILVTNVNEAPSFVSNPVLNAEVNNLYTYNIVTIDPDAGDTHTITVNGLPSELSFTDNGDGTASISGTPNRLPDGKYNITLTVTDAGGLTATQAFELSPQVNLVEETNFAVSRSLSFTIPTVPSILSFKIDPQFDNADLDSINDAFEVALIDANGNSLVHTVANGRDAFFNWTEGEAITLGAGASYNTSDRIISLNLVGITPGTNARLVFRLVNNDSDIATNVRITDFEILDAPFGTQPPLGSSFVTQGTLQVVPNFNLLADVSQSFVAQYHSTSFNADTHLLYANIAIQNIGSYSVDAPLIVAVDRISNPNVFVRNPDGFTPDGIPYYDFTKLVGDKKLDPNELTQERSLIFYNPEQVQFTYNLTVLSELNAAPVIQTQANKEIIAGYNYSYDVDATDPNGDSLQYKLLVSPDGMTIDPSTGLISWNTTGTNVSNQTVLI